MSFFREATNGDNCWTTKEISGRVVVMYRRRPFSCLSGVLSFRLGLANAYRTATLVNAEDIGLEPSNSTLAMISRAYLLC